MEGTWGLVHWENHVTVDGEIEEDRIVDYNPYAPTGDDDYKIVIINTSGSTYLFTYYYWDSKKSTWVFRNKQSFRIKGNQLYDTNSTTEESSGIIDVTSDTLTMENSFSAKRDGSRYGKEGNVVYYRHWKLSFRKMSDLTE